MQIQCEKCGSKYLVPDHAIGAQGRTVRCANCQHNWFVAPPAAAQAAPVEMPKEAPREPKPVPRGSNLPVIKHPPVPAGIKAGAGVLAAVAAALALFVFKPALYGYPPSAGLALAEVNMLSRLDDKHPENRHPIYEISGKILNTAEETLEVPVLRITLTDKEGTPLQYWDFSEKGRTLEGGKNIPFTTGPLDIKFNQPSKFVVELGNEMELAMRGKPE